MDRYGAGAACVDHRPAAPGHDRCICELSFGRSRVRGDRRDRQSVLPMKIKYHDDFPNFDHRTRSLVLEAAGSGNRFAIIVSARPGDGRHDQLGSFQRHFWGELIRYQQSRQVDYSAVWLAGG